jgi:type I restriction enzyme S subunit
MEWKKHRIGDLVDVKHGFAFKGEYFSDEPNKNILLTPGNFHIGGGFKNDKLKYYTGEIPEDYILNEGDIIVTMTDLSKQSDTLGYSAKIPATGTNKYLHNQRLGLLKFKSDEVEKEFIYWVMRTAPYHNYIVGSATGSTVKHTSPSRIASYEFYAPQTKNEQLFLASVLNSLEEKIELNLQMNRTLRAIAQTVFKEWFVTLNFPGFNGTFKNGLPIGWKKIKLKEIIEVKHGYAFKGEFFSDFETENILLTPGNFKIGGGFNVNKFKYYTGDVPQEYILNSNDLIVTMTDLSKEGDTLGYSALVPVMKDKIFLHNQRIGKIIFKSFENAKYYLYFLMQQPSYRNFILGSATGSTVKHTSPKRICDYEIALPDDQTLNIFEELAFSLVQKEQEIFINNQALNLLRERLLPKLILGKIEIKA